MATEFLSSQNKHQPANTHATSNGDNKHAALTERAGPNKVAWKHRETPHRHTSNNTARRGGEIIQTARQHNNNNRAQEISKYEQWLPARTAETLATRRAQLAHTSSEGKLCRDRVQYKRSASAHSPNERLARRRRER